MRELDRLRRGLEATLDGDPWYGLAVAAILDGVSAEGAAARPIPEAHSIWELVLHMTSWVNETNRRLRGGGHAEPVEGDWPAVGELTAASWQAARAALATAHGTLAATLTSMDVGELEHQIGTQVDAAGQPVTRYQTILGLLQHDAYHAGQIALLKKALTLSQRSAR
jgi:uncharacterized damage-inducible protein DinB